MKNLIGLFSILIATSSHAQQVIPIYNGTAPGSENWTQIETEYINPVNKTKMVRNVVIPTLTIFLPDPKIATGTGIVIAPGGGFRWLSFESEGTKVAEWLQAHGIAAFVLKYRLVDMGANDEEFSKKSNAFITQLIESAKHPNTKGENQIEPEVASVIEMAMNDGRQAIKYVRNNALTFNLNTNHIGIMGFSAGGMVTMGSAYQHDNESKPNFIAPIYSPFMSNMSVPEDAMPLFFLCSADDSIAANNAYKFYEQWKNANKSVEFHVYSKGGHGFGMEKQNLPTDNWINVFYDWLKAEALLN